VSRRNALWLFGLLLLIALAYGDILAGSRALYLQDLTSYHFPMKHIVRDAVRSGELPYWNPFYSAGQPLAANPAYELFYPLQWLVVLLPFAYAFQLHIIIHFALAAIGAFLLIRSFGVKAPAAAIGAAAFVFGGPYLSLSSKLPLLFSMSWMPLVLLLTRRAIDRGSVARIFAAAAAISMQLIIGEPTIVIQTWALIAGYAVYRLIEARGSGRWRAIVLPIFLPIMACGATAVLIAAVQLLPAIDFARDTVRSRGLSFRAVADWSFPFVRLEEMLLPSLFHHVTGSDGQAAIRTLYTGRIVPFLFEIYCGALFVIVAFAGVLARVRGRWLFLLAFCGSIVVALGDHTPILRLLYEAGLASAIRFPEKLILTTGFVIAVWSAIVMQKLFDGDRLVARRATILAAIWAALSLVLAMAGTDKSYFYVNVGRAALVLVALLLVASGRDAWRVAVLCAVAVADLWLGSLGAVPRMPSSFFDAPALESELNAFRGQRLFHDAGWSVWDDEPIAGEFFGDAGSDRFWWMLRNGEFWDFSAAWNHPLVLEPDIDATSLKNTDDFRMTFNLVHARHTAGGDDPYLRMANASGRVVFRTLNDATRSAVVADAPRFTPVTAVPFETTPRYAFATRMARLSSPGELGPMVENDRSASAVALVDLEPFQPANGEVLSVREGWNSIKLNVRSSGRGFLVMSVTGHKYWKAALDSREAPLIATNVAFQGLIVPPGTHTVEMRYRNPLVAVGGAITLATLAALAVAAVLTRRSHGMQTLFI
jgi:hypothetical protein